MFQSEQGTYYGAGNFIGSLLSVADDPPSDVLGGQGWSGNGTEATSTLSEVQMKAMYESSKADALADVSLQVSPSTTKPLSDNFVAENYDSLIETPALSYSAQYSYFKNEILETPAQLNHWMPQDETISTMTFMDTVEWQQPEVKPSTMNLDNLQHNLGFPFRGVINHKADDVQFDYHGKIPTSASPSTPSRRPSRKAALRSKEETERHRRFMFSEKLRALRELLPGALKGNQNSIYTNRDYILDSSMGYIKYLEHQLKDLTASRLGGGSISAPLFFLEGHGHYGIHDKFFEETVEEVFGGFLEENPTAASKLLDSKGLYMVPIDSIHAICSSIAE